MDCPYCGTDGNSARGKETLRDKIIMKTSRVEDDNVSDGNYCNLSANLVVTIKDSTNTVYDISWCEVSCTLLRSATSCLHVVHEDI